MISVIVPIYNVEKYLPACMDSILEQSYKDIEIIMVDDGATDSCPAICDEYAKKDARIHVIHQENGGLSAARNAGLAASKGEYIIHVDSDDFFISRDAIQVMYDLLIKEDADMCITNYVSVTEDGEIIPEIGITSHEQINKDFNRNEYKVIDEKAFWDWKVFRRDRIRDTVVWGRIYKRHICEEVLMPVGVFFEDERVIYDTIHICNKIVVSDYITMGYRQRSGSFMHLDFSEKNMSKAESVILEIEKLEARGWYEYSLPLFLDGSSVLVIAYTNRKKVKTDELRNSLYEQYKAQAKKMLKRGGIPTSRRMQLIVFTLSLPLYRLVRNLVSKKKY